MSHKINQQREIPKKNRAFTKCVFINYIYQNHHEKRIVTMKRALALSGGGSNGAFEVGAIEYLVFHEKYDFQIFLGTSVGALNVAILGQAASYQELCTETVNLKNFWLSIKNNNDIYTKTILGYVTLLFQSNLYKPAGLEKLLKQYIDINRIYNNADHVTKIVTVAMETGELLYADSRRPELKNEFLKYILSSASMPLFFPSVEINRQHWYDGGLRDITPLGSIFDEAPDEIVIITTYPLTTDLSPVILKKNNSKSTTDILLRTIDVLTAEIGANDIQIANLINQNIDNYPGKRQVPIRLISPAVPFDANILDFIPAVIQGRIQQGFTAAQNSRFL